ncbi:hypothetical protein [Coprococcus comes]|uniref:hypothetical protein n=1 Tax=Coprococcus comes TaxID=410072 RepID=UPI003565C86C
MDIITGYTGSPHVTAEQDRDVNIGIFGAESYVLRTGSRLKAEVSSNNEIKVRDGVIMHQGCAASIKKNTYDSLTIANGSQGMKRVDLIVARYSRDQNTKEESLVLKVIQGTPKESGPAVPGYTTGDIQAGDLIADMPLYQVTLNGLNITEVKQLFATQDSIAELSSKLTETTAGLSKANNSLGVIGTQYFGKTASYSYRNANNWVNNVAKVTLPKGTYIFTITAKPQALGQNLDAFTLGVTGVSWWEAQSTSLIYFGSGFYPTCTHTFVASVNAGTYGLAIWSSHNRTVNDVEITATRIK